MPELLVAVAIVFTVVTGANDGGALIATGLRVPALSTAASLLMLTVAVVACPLLLSTAVAETIAGTIVPPGRDGSTALLVGIVVATTVVAGLAWASRPTSLTLAVVGGIAGAGAGLGVPVGWSTVARVLAIGLAAPVAGALVALVGSRLWRAKRDARYLTTVRRAHVVAFGAQCVAYGTNDGQKTLVLFLAAGAVGGSASPATAGVPWWSYPAVAAAFALGAVLGLPKAARSVGAGIISTRATHAVTAEFASAVTVLGSAAAGAPVSMTQAVSGALIGTGVHDTYRRVRWKVVRNLALAWAVTLPASFGLAYVVAIALPLP